MPTTLVLNPRDDARFVALAEAMVTDGVDSPDDLQARLRTEFPDAIVRARELDGEAPSIWYVYRDGHWIPRITEIEHEKGRLSADDPKPTELSFETERLARRIVPKAAAERDLVDRLAGQEGSES